MPRFFLFYPGFLGVLRRVGGFRFSRPLRVRTRGVLDPPSLAYCAARATV